MKYMWLAVLLTVCVLVSPVMAEDEPISVPKLGLPDMQAGMLYSVETGEFEACATATVLGYPTKVGKFEIRAGYATDNMPIGAVCFKLGDLSQFGFDQPLHKIINLSVGPYAGYDIDNDEFDWGMLATIIQLKF